MSAKDTQLHAALTRAAAGVALPELRRRVADLSHRYRTEQVADAAPALNDALDCLAYAVMRMPATYRALHAALTATERHVRAPISTHLDLGGGTGAAAWAAAAVWPGVTTELMERQRPAIQLGRQLAAEHLPTLRWTTADLRSGDLDRDVDLITIGYVLNELAEADRAAVVKAAARAATTIVIVEPGTPRGHRRTVEARAVLIEHGFAIAAPCPHQYACPIVSPDWCHFAVRLPRTELHRVLKDGVRNFEDEKFSYVVATRAPAVPAANRVLARPARPKNRIILDLCTAAGTKTHLTIPKSADTYRPTRHTTWGAPWPD
ncbi:small ribosomal subunit Rsm22 family protein [Kribbella solani]|uniref:small ribosomal subunit Rsm22 family protein n=1 Tax=Kribbella solani TaxID=236067 RepID=UPI0029A74711|nr:small ribosomal subunit Rsm22 family protein [Kribbella solani]MDX2968068.1 small ribosomal subunit Rsm22 family protein [Kribbella solani]